MIVLTIVRIVRMIVRTITLITLTIVSADDLAHPASRRHV